MANNTSLYAALKSVYASGNKYTVLELLEEWLKVTKEYEGVPLIRYDISITASSGSVSFTYMSHLDRELSTFADVIKLIRDDNNSDEPIVANGMHEALDDGVLVHTSVLYIMQEFDSFDVYGCKTTAPVTVLSGVLNTGTVTCFKTKLI